MAGGFLEHGCTPVQRQFFLSGVLRLAVAPMGFEHPCLPLGSLGVLVLLLPALHLVGRHRTNLSILEANAFRGLGVDLGSAVRTDSTHALLPGR